MGQPGSRRGDEPADRRVGVLGARELALVAAGLVLLAAVAWSAARAEVGGRAPSIEARAPGDDAWRNNAVLVAAGAAGMLVVLALAAWYRGRGALGVRSREHDPRPSSWRRVLATLLLGFTFVAALMLAGADERDEPDPPPAAPGSDAPEPVASEPVDRARGWAAAALVASGAVVVLAGVFVVHRSRRSRYELAERARAAGVHAPGPPDLDRLDPAGAVRAAYAAAREALERAGVAERPAETPHEYLRRATARHADAGPALERLTACYEIARFSHHPVTAAMKHDAIGSYVDIVRLTAAAGAGELTGVR